MTKDAAGHGGRRHPQKASTRLSRRKNSALVTEMEPPYWIGRIYDRKAGSSRTAAFRAAPWSPALCLVCKRPCKKIKTGARNPKPDRALEESGELLPHA